VSEHQSSPPPIPAPLSVRCSAETLQRLLRPLPPWQPPPLAVELQSALIALAERAMTKRFPSLPATLWLDYERSGTSAPFDQAQIERRDILRDLVVGEAIEGRGRFLDAIVDAAWATCEETWWGSPSHAAMQGRPGGLPDPGAPIVDLFAAETAATLAWTLHLHAHSLEGRAAGVAAHIRAELRRRMLEPCRERDDFWWMGLTGVGFGGRPGANRIVNNWNPWICSNWIATAVLAEDDPDTRARSVAKALRVLDAYLAVLPEDGSCEEGTAYWSRAGATLFEALELVSRTTGGAVEVFDHPALAEVARFPARMQLGGRWFVNFGDGHVRPALPAGVVYRFGRVTADADVVALGAELLGRWEPGAESSRHDSLARTLGILDVVEEARAAPRSVGLPAFTWLPGDEVMVARETAGSTAGLTVAARARHNGTPHGHNDVGTFIVALDGEPVVVDAGVGAYTAATFGPDRFEIWTMRSGYHNVPMVGGVEQAAGAERAATDVRSDDDGHDAVLALDLAGAYPEDAGLDRWQRTIALQRARRVVSVRDEWHLRDPARVTLNLLLRDEPSVEGASLRLTGLDITFEPGPVTIAVERVPLEDVLASSWDRSALWRASACYPDGVAGSVTTTIAVGR
jgi:hypothetical protein